MRPSAQAPTVCIGADCAIDGATRTALDDAGLTSVDGLRFHSDAAGQMWLDILSTDAEGLNRIGPASDARTTPIRGTASHVRTVPVALTDIDTITVGPIGLEAGFIEIDGIDSDSGSGGGGGGGGSSECTESCVCTEDGIECWLEC